MVFRYSWLPTSGGAAEWISLLVSGYEPDPMYSSDYNKLPTVHVLEILSGDIAEQIERVVISAQDRWAITDVLLALIVPGTLLMAVIALMRLKPLAEAAGARRRRAAGLTRERTC